MTATGTEDVQHCFCSVNAVGERMCCKCYRSERQILDEREIGSISQHGYYFYIGGKRPCARCECSPCRCGERNAEEFTVDKEKLPPHIRMTAKERRQARLDTPEVKRGSR